MLSLGPPRPRRKPSLTPMIDVVFLLLVFFMLASRFGSDFAVPLKLAGVGDAPYAGPPRIIDILPEGQRLNGRDIDPATLLVELKSLTETPDDTIILRPQEGAVLQRIVDTMGALQADGFTTLVLVE